MRDINSSVNKINMSCLDSLRNGIIVYERNLNASLIEKMKPLEEYFNSLKIKKQGYITNKFNSTLEFY